MKSASFISASILTVIFSAMAFAGNLDAPGTPNLSNSYKIDDIYNRLNNGTPGSQSTFTGPSAGAIGGTGHTLNEVMGKAPAKDDTNGAVPANVMSGKTFWGLNKASEKWGPQTGSRFTDNGDGTVRDNLTGLIWLKNANCAGTARNWTSALSDVASLNSAGTMNGNNCGDTGNHNDWRLPNIVELQSLSDFAYFDPALSNDVGDAKWGTAGTSSFTDVQSYFYWSATTYANNAANAWYVALNIGHVGGNDKSATLYVWPVR